MGIQGLSKVIGDYAQSAVKENEIKNYFGEQLCFMHFEAVERSELIIGSFQLNSTN